jgi:hypothetical protein
MKTTTTKYFLLALAVAFAANVRADVTGGLKVSPPPAPVVPPQPAPEQQSEDKKPSVAPARSVYDQAFDRTFKQATDGWLEDPLRFIHGDMSESEKGLTALKTDKPVQKVQDQAVARLDKVIELLDKQCSSAGGKSGAHPSKPLAKSVIMGGPGGQGDMHDPKAGEMEWAKLQPKQREQILQSQTEGFPPGYESILQSYYERLAQEEVGGGGDNANSTEAAPASNTKPAAGGRK